jgi:RimJ/RimL family protein N-acetyltransferase
MIETSRLLLRRWEPSDVVDEGLYGDAETMRLFGTGSTFTLEEVRASTAGVISEYAKPGYGNLAVVEKATGAIIGHCGVHPPRAPEVWGEADWLIARRAWGRGYATEAARAIFGNAFLHHGAPGIVGVAHRENFASIGVMRKLHMQYATDTMRYDAPSVVYRVSAEEFLAGFPGMFR